MIINDSETAIDVKVDLYSDAKENWLVSGSLNKFKFPFRVVGGDETEPSKYISPYFFLKYGWQVRPYEGTHILTITGILLVDGGGDPFVSTIGDYNVRTKFVIPIDAVTIATGGSALTSEEHDKLMTGLDSSLPIGVWNASLSSYSSGSAGYALDLIRKVESGKWKAVGTQMIFYDDDGVTPLLTFDLKDENGNPIDASEDVFERIPV